MISGVPLPQAPMKIEHSDKAFSRKNTRPKSIHDVNKKFQEIFKQDDSINRKTI